MENELKVNNKMNQQKAKQKQEDQQYRDTLKRLIKEYVKPNIGWFAFAFGLAAIAGATSGASVQALKPVVNDIFVAKDGTRVVGLALLVIGIFAVRGTAIYFQQLIMSRVGNQIVKDIQVRLANNLLKQSQQFFNQNRSGDIQAVIQMQTGMLRSAIDECVIAVRDVVSIISLVTVMFYNNWELSLVALFILPVAVFPLRKLSKKMRHLGAALNSETGMLIAVVGETMRNVKVVQSYTQEEKELSRIEESADQLRQLMVRRQKIVGLTSPLMEALGGIAIGLVIMYGGWQVTSEGVDTGSFMAFIAAFLLAYEPIKRLGKVQVSIQFGLTAGKTIYEHIDRTPSIRDKEGAKDLQHKEGEISLEDVYFSYHGDRKDHPPALRNINLKVKAGTSVALVGQSGSGKSTFVTLVQRFWDPTKGRISIDGQDIKDVRIQSLRENIAYVGQEVILFDSTVKSNIAYGNNEATMEDIIEAAKNANAHEFIEKLPKGYDTLIGEQGVLLSGGQRQRLSIARAMIKKAPILLLDEATSALDTESERLVQDALERLMEDRTVIVIAHRLSTIIASDLICVMRDGEIIEKGKHKELLAQNGAYKKMYDVQFQG